MVMLHRSFSKTHRYTCLHEFFASNVAVLTACAAKSVLLRSIALLAPALTHCCACSIAAVLLQIDTAIQYGEDLDPDTRDRGPELSD